MLIGKLGEDRVIYDCLDDFKSFPGVPARLITRLDRRLAQAADVVFTTSKGLWAQKSPLNPRCHLIPNGVDYDFFASDAPKPRFLEGIPRPVIGYAGLIGDWLDLNLLDAVAKAFPEGSFVLVGPVRTTAPLPKRSNLYFPGQVPYELLPGLLRGFDVGIIPFKVNELTINTNPVKVYEYLAAGLPVVSTGLPELQEMAEKGYVMTGGSPPQWVELLKKALEEQDPSLVEARRRFARECSWERRVRQMEEVLNALVEE